MKIRSQIDLCDTLDGAIAWRKKELAYLKTLVHKHRYEPAKLKPLLRSAVALLYAHFEGFIKNAGEAYVEFVARKALSYRELKPNFVAMSIKEYFNRAIESDKPKLYTDIADVLLNKLSTKCNLNWSSAISTKANLSSKVFEGILFSLGLNVSLFTTKEKLIDRLLLRRRNKIAHGQYLDVDYDDIINLQEEVLLIMEQFRNEIENAAAQNSFKN